VWFDVSLWREAAAHAAKALMEMDPVHAAGYQANAGGYLDRLSELDGYVRKQAERVPPRQRVLITAHDAFNYFGRAYGFEVRGLQGISTVAEAGTADIQALVRLILANRIPAVFVETSVPVRYIEALQEAVEAGGFRLRIGGSLYSDALGDPGTPEGPYRDGASQCGYDRGGLDRFSACGRDGIIIRKPEERCARTKEPRERT
jgi:manganese/zinc/iron transport system substrate-binding protein